MGPGQYSPNTEQKNPHTSLRPPPFFTKQNLADSKKTIKKEAPGKSLVCALPNKVLIGPGSYQIAHSIIKPKVVPIAGDPGAYYVVENGTM